MTGYSSSVTSRPNERQTAHKHADARLIVIEAGRLIEHTYDGDTEFLPGDILYRPSYFYHANTSGDAGVKYRHVDVAAANAQRWLRLHGWQAGCARAPFGIRELSRLSQSRHFGEALFDCIVVRRTNFASPPISIWDLAKEEMSAPGSPRVHEVAAGLNMTPCQFSRFFKDRFGLSPRSYRNQLRFHRAMKLLVEDTSSLTEVAYVSGYFDQSHLARVIKAETGSPPGKVRAHRGAV